MSILEHVRGKAFSQLAYLRYSAVGLTLFMFLLYLGLRNDLFSAWQLACEQWAASALSR